MKSCPVACDSCSSGTPQQQHSLLSSLFFSRPPTPETYLESGLGQPYFSARIAAASPVVIQLTTALFTFYMLSFALCFRVLRYGLFVTAAACF